MWVKQNNSALLAKGKVFRGHMGTPPQLRNALTFLAMSRSLQASWAFLSASAMRCVNSSLRDCTLELSSFRLIVSLQNTFRHLTLIHSVDQSNSHYCSFPNDIMMHELTRDMDSFPSNSIGLSWLNGFNTNAWTNNLQIKYYEDTYTGHDQF